MKIFIYRAVIEQFEVILLLLLFHVKKAETTWPACPISSETEICGCGRSPRHYIIPSAVFLSYVKQLGEHLDPLGSRVSPENEIRHNTCHILVFGLRPWRDAPQGAHY